jgi:cell division protein FtsB
MYLSDAEEIVAYIACIAIVIGFIVSTYMEIKNTLAEEKEKLAEKKKNETKIKTLIEYLDAKRELIDVIAKKQESQNKEKNKK